MIRVLKTADFSQCNIGKIDLPKEKKTIVYNASNVSDVGGNIKTGKMLSISKYAEKPRFAEANNPGFYTMIGLELPTDTTKITVKNPDYNRYGNLTYALFKKAALSKDTYISSGVIYDTDCVQWYAEGEPSGNVPVTDPVLLDGLDYSNAKDAENNTFTVDTIRESAECLAICLKTAITDWEIIIEYWE